ncbi:helix-turn-helix domain-containing protein, partial [Planctomycetota bacterium]|nr:helix-turn-helix domain-containing protein [Planctomycetota bacterium]
PKKKKTKTKTVRRAPERPLPAAPREVDPVERFTALAIGDTIGGRRLLGEQIRTARNESGLTQAKLARLLDCSNSQVSRWEWGFAAPTRDQLRKLALLALNPPRKKRR